MKPPANEFLTGKFLGATPSSTVRFSGTDTLYNYENDPNPIYNPEITYIYNKKGYRCDEFENLKDYPFKIVYLGCSQTVGIGLRLEDCWAFKLNKQIENYMNCTIPYLNIAEGGKGLDNNVRSLNTYIDELKPNLIICLLPEPTRREISLGNYFTVQNKNKMIDIFLDKKFTQYQTEKNLAFINLLCEKYNSKLLLLYIKESHKEDLHWDLSSLTNVYECQTPTLNLKGADTARDNKHYGPKTNDTFARLVCLRLQNDYFPRWNIQPFSNQKPK